MSNKTGGPAFPMMHKWEVGSEGCEVVEYYAGMTLRDYFAAKAMQGFCVPSPDDADIEDWHFDLMAKHAYMISDAMIAEREKNND